jgi:biotin carboxyl carrier protein
MKSFIHQTSEAEQSVSYDYTAGKLTVEGQVYDCDGRSVWVDGKRIPFWTHREGDKISVWLDGEVTTFAHKDPRQRQANSTSVLSTGAVRAQMPGKILSLAVKAGDIVVKGQNLLVMESMKMELSLEAPIDGRVESVDVDVDQMVSLGQQLINIDGSLPAKPR